MAVVIFAAVMIVISFLYNLLVAAIFPVSSSTVTYNEVTGAVTVSGGGPPGGFWVSMIIYEIVYVVLGWIIGAQMIRAGLENTKAGRITMEVFSRTQYLGTVILACLIVAIFEIIGLALCIVPGLIVMFFVQFTIYFVLDQSQSPMEAIGSSFKFVNANLANVFLLFLASILAMIVGALACGVGLLIAVPVVVVAHAYTYRVLQGQPVAA